MQFIKVYLYIYPPGESVTEKRVTWSGTLDSSEDVVTNVIDEIESRATGELLAIGGSGPQKFKIDVFSRGIEVDAEGVVSVGDQVQIVKGGVIDTNGHGLAFAFGQIASLSSTWLDPRSTWDPEIREAIDEAVGAP